ncbi:Protein of unknown function [Streptococcus thermophilus]|nr:Protein of unknown function [Streptococcus thermophilus]
MLKGEGEPDA